MILTLENIGIVKNFSVIFRNFGLCLSNGSCLVITGSNGAGKTSLLNVLSGLLKPNSGIVKVNDVNIEEVYDEYCRSIRYITHENCMMENLTIRENLEFYLNLYGEKLLFSAAMKYFKLNEIADIKFWKLPEGVKRRVSLARLLYCPAEIWLLDEPTTNLDSDGRLLVMDLVNSKTSSGGVVIIATHDKELFKLGSVLNIEEWK